MKFNDKLKAAMIILFGEKDGTEYYHECINHSKGLGMVDVCIRADDGSGYSVDFSINRTGTYLNSAGPHDNNDE